jgi:hypothetical protein
VLAAQAWPASAGAAAAADGELAIRDRRSGAVHRWRAAAVAAGDALVAGRLRPVDSPAWAPPSGWGAVESLAELPGQPLDLRPLPGERPEAVRGRWERLVHAASVDAGALEALAPTFTEMVAQEGWSLPVTLPLERLQELVHESLVAGSRHADLVVLAERIKLLLPPAVRPAPRGA